MSQAEVIEKVRKLRALAAATSSVHEAATAAAAAEKLLQQHRIEEAELEPQDTDAACVDNEPVETFGGSRIVLWKVMLANGLTRLHGCYAWTDRRSKPSCIRVAGSPSDVATVRYLYAWLILEINRLATRNGGGRGAADSYRKGAVVGVIEAMRSAHQAVRATASTTALARVDSRGQQAARAAHAAFPGLKNHRNPLNIQTEAFEQGRVAGRNIHQGERLSAGSTPRLLGSGNNN